ncbi:relaxase/mobilization nuclease domain-containing protein (plasmid) [Methylobacterium sp. NMS12]|uniref:relaxase/mobilization nuclease domain-containing protein n=1 Tax=Methylobacterium sp. NMS12 TaxID=3079766 RepID=UPI003F884494
MWQTPIRRPKRQPWDMPAAAGGTAVTPAMRARLERIVARVPEVMVKITGRTKGVAHLCSHLAYITRNGDLAAETETGVVMEGREGLRDLQDRWSEDVALDLRRANRTLSVNMILSMPPGTDGTKVRDAVRAFAIDTFEGRHDYAFVLHQDDVHPHVHLTVRAAGYDGRRLNPRKADLYQWRELFAQELRSRGVAAEATPRRTRGKVRKADRGKVRAIKERGEQPCVERQAREEVTRVRSRETTAERPWETRIRKRQADIRARYLTFAEEIGRSRDPADRALSVRIRGFVEAMPPLETRRHALREELARMSALRKSQREPFLGSDVREDRGSGEDRSR